MDIWFAKNGDFIDWSNSRITLHGNNAKALPSWNYVGTFSSGEYAEICWWSADTNLQITSETSPPSGPTRPAIPSIILTVWQLYSQYTK